MHKAHIKALDGIRGMAVAFVFLLHYAGGAQSHHLLVHALGTFVKFGWTGVSLFFALSGFLITGILWDDQKVKGWWRRFYTKRALRIFPLYYLAVVLLIVTVHWSYNAASSRRGILDIALFLQNEPFASADIRLNSPFVVSHFWSLAIEEQFYLLWPFCLVAMRSLRAARWACLTLFLASFTFRVVALHTGWPPFGGATLNRAGELALGAWLALAYKEQGVIWQRVVKLAWIVWALATGGLIAVCAVAGPLYDTPTMSVAGLTLLAIWCSSFLALALTNGVVRRSMEPRLLRWLGKLSYGIYVYSVLLSEFYAGITAWLVPHAGVAEQRAVQMMVALPLTLLVAAVSFRWFERPIMNLRSRLLAQPSGSGQTRLAASEQP